MTCFTLKNGTTVHKWCVQNNVCYATIFRYLEEGMYPDEVTKHFMKIKKNKNNLKFQYKGVPIKRMYKEDKSYQLVLRKIREGMTIEEAIQYEKKYRRFKNENKHRK